MPSVYFYIGPILGLLQNVVPPHMRATTCALLLFTANVCQSRDRPAVDRVAERLVFPGFGAGTESLRWALLILAPSGFWAAWHLAVARGQSQLEKTGRNAGGIKELRMGLSAQR